MDVANKSSARSGIIHLLAMTLSYAWGLGMSSKTVVPSSQMRKARFTRSRSLNRVGGL